MIGDTKVDKCIYGVSGDCIYNVDGKCTEPWITITDSNGCLDRDRRDEN